MTNTCWQHGTFPDAGGFVSGLDGANASGGGGTGNGDGSAGTGGVRIDAPLGSGGIIPNGGSGGTVADVPLGGAGGAGGGGGSNDLPVELPSPCQSAKDGTPCGDGMVCNKSQCVACAAGGTCTVSNPCHKGVYSCATGTSVCQDSGNAAEGTDCGGGNVCRNGTCSACVGGQECPLTGQPCRKGILTCSAGASSCVDNGAKPDLTACDDNNACTTGESCHSGLCNGGTTKTCTASDVCHAAGTCDPTTGVCSNPSVVAPEARDCTSSQDNDCDGIPDNTLDGVCQCKPGSIRDCDTHPGFDGKGPCKAGIQNCVLGTDHSTSYYEASCTGAVGPALKDSCNIAMDDSNCNGTFNDGCSCTPANAATACNDNKACTADSCSNGQCQNVVQSGYCLIAGTGTCYSNGTVDPNNPCRRCDSSTSATSWTNFPNGQSCDDGLWCNGDADKCDGNGACSHTYPNNNRCAGTTGACASTSCSESTKTCFQPSSVVCQTETLSGCLANTCSSDVMTWKVDHYCKGDRTDCSGGQTVDRQSAATVAQNCSSSQICSSGQCTEALKCSSSVYCDSSSGLCWMTADTTTEINQDDAKIYCNNLSLAGNSNWSLPTKSQFATITRGCPSGPCPSHQGPGLDGCYWPIEMGRCDNQLWTSDSAFAWIVQEGTATMTIPSLTSYRIRCVVTGP